MNITINKKLLFYVDKPNQHNELLKSIYSLKNIEPIDIRDLEFTKIRELLSINDDCIVLLFMDEPKGRAINLLYSIYSSCCGVPYVVGIFCTNSARFLEHAKYCGISKLFCKKFKDYSDFKVVRWVKMICRYLNASCILPYEGSCMSSYARYKISQKLKKLGMTVHLTGYKYILDAIELYVKDLNFRITSDIYKTLSIRYNTAVANIDRCMRHAIEVTWRDSSISCLQKYYPKPDKVYENRPSVLEFVSCIAKQLRQELTLS